MNHDKGGRGVALAISHFLQNLMVDQDSNSYHRCTCLGNNDAEGQGSWPLFGLCTQR